MLGPRLQGTSPPAGRWKLRCLTTAQPYGCRCRGSQRNHCVRDRGRVHPGCGAFLGAAAYFVCVIHVSLASTGTLNCLQIRTQILLAAASGCWRLVTPGGGVSDVGMLCHCSWQSYYKGLDKAQAAAAKQAEQAEFRNQIQVIHCSLSLCRLHLPLHLSDPGNSFFPTRPCLPLRRSICRAPCYLM